MNNPSTQHLNLELPKFELQLLSLLEIAILVLVSFLIYSALKKIQKSFLNHPAFEGRKQAYRFFNSLTLTLPSVIFVYGLSILSEDSWLLNFGIFVALTFVFGFSLTGPARSLVAMFVLKLRGDLKVGGFVEIGEHRGRIKQLGPLNLHLLTPSGDQTLIPGAQVLESSVSIGKSRTHPMVIVTLPGIFSIKAIESLAHLCPYKKEETDITVTLTSEKNIEVGIEVSHEVTHAEHGKEIEQYFLKQLRQSDKRPT